MVMRGEFLVGVVMDTHHLHLVIVEQRPIVLFEGRRAIPRGAVRNRRKTENCARRPR
jgi:hypothetical protein